MGRQIITEEDAKRNREANLQRIVGVVRAAVIDYIGMNGPITCANQVMPAIEKRLRGEE